MPKPAIMQLRENIYPFAQYRDVKGSWKFRVALTNLQYIIIIDKKECSSSVKESEYFDFTWELIVRKNLLFLLYFSYFFLDYF